MLSLFERFYLLGFTYLLGFSFLSFCWACKREQLGVEQVACRVVTVGALLLLVTFAIAVFGLS